jgi:hypothetical protein
VGSAFSWKSKGGNGSQTITEIEPGRFVRMQQDLGPHGRPVQSFYFAAESGGTRVTWALDADFGFNPIGRVFGRFLDRHLGPIYEMGLSRLADVLAGTSRPRQNVLAPSDVISSRSTAAAGI